MSFTIEEARKNKILSEYGTKANVYTLNEFVGSDGEIPNPYGKPLTAYGECYEILREFNKRTCRKIKLHCGGRIMTGKVIVNGSPLDHT